MTLTVELEIFSPRWGHVDTYCVKLDREFLEIEMHLRISRAIYQENQDPTWEGESIHAIMNNDHIYPPEVTQELFEYAWLKWRKGEIDDNQVSIELQVLGKWINEVTRLKPNTDFWSMYF